ncbi:hypothetical protein SAMN05443429_10881 [Cruoricaptor ignavus]|uniref:Uncharacterized protein n=1 Tax=Cruoricaptor ignavus TaxID=1118202 RepID=A0A1M6G6V6_9FLAO|nr:hypothetical protein [Cruoricaptor ignavus]SHJ05701.1 hypothetical protein SAMN05443429_10881 [Cruoricaptor ignavus]
MKDEDIRTYYPVEDEFTEAMHEEFTVPDEVDVKHRVWSLIWFLEIGEFTLEELLTEFRLTREQYERYRNT